MTEVNDCDSWKTKQVRFDFKGTPLRNNHTPDSQQLGLQNNDIICADTFPLHPFKPRFKPHVVNVCGCELCSFERYLHAHFPSSAPDTYAYARAHTLVSRLKSYGPCTCIYDSDSPLQKWNKISPQDTGQLW